MPDKLADVIIIGSGAGGGACAWALASRGIRVHILEAGPAYEFKKDYKLHLADWETRGFPEKLTSSGRQTFAELQELDDRWSELYSWNHLFGRFNPESRRKAFAYHHVVGVGGSTLHFSGEAHRLNPQSMQMKSRFDVAADWPLSYAELEPYYLQAEHVVGVAGENEDRRCWRSAPYPLTAHALNYGSRRLQQGCEKLGLNLQPNTLAILSSPYDGRPACNHCNNCNKGCPRADKGSVDVTFIRQALATGNCSISTEVQVTQLLAGRDDRIASIEYRDKVGEEHSIKAGLVVLACGAIETPRLLLNSSNAYAADGLANESGQVGRNFMETISWVASGLHSESLGSHRGIPADSICWDFNQPDAIEGVIGGFRFSSAVAETDLVGPVNYAQRVVGGWGLAHKQQMRETFGKVLTLSAIGESLPNEKSFIDLDPVETDQAGLAKARIHSHLDEMALKRLSFMAKTCRSVLEASGVESLFEEYGSYDFFSSTHVFGTCRMGADAETSVLDQYGRSHRWKNLFIADASVFPSSGGGEAPSLTIEALAIRTAEHIVQLSKSNAV